MYIPETTDKVKGPLYCFYTGEWIPGSQIGCTDCSPPDCAPPDWVPHQKSIKIN